MAGLDFKQVSSTYVYTGVTHHYYTHVIGRLYFHLRHLSGAVASCHITVRIMLKTEQEEALTLFSQHFIIYLRLSKCEEGFTQKSIPICHFLTFRYVTLLRGVMKARCTNMLPSLLILIQRRIMVTVPYIRMFHILTWNKEEKQRTELHTCTVTFVSKLQVKKNTQRYTASH
jgi:hypothetical protein